MALFDFFLLEAIINGILFGGVLALLALGLNLVFGVVDVIWIAYAELVMSGMYIIYTLHITWGWPLLLAAPMAIVGVGLMGLVVHRLIIAPILDTPPINQLLATGGLLFFLQNFATLIFGADFRNIGLSLPILQIFELYISFSRLLSFGAAVLGMIGLYLFLSRTYIGTAIRAVAQDREIMSLMGVNTKKVYLITSALAGAMAGLAAILLVLQQDVHPFIGFSFGPITFMICVMGGLGNLIGGFFAAFIISQIISIGSFYGSTELSYVIAFVLFIIVMFIRPQGIFKRNT
ncbi:MAG: branched-chain amino acid ABC transporter permease [SAR324 cluster bacterium]|nr:branched-chain amino acid ABC transporter permease [SAR324 cluster bacterium]MCH8887113.1 branched-chain amino acid ABC transporter permease [SAR324 cluster bacterium]